MSPLPIETILETALNAYELRVDISMRVRDSSFWEDYELDATYGRFYFIQAGKCQVQGIGAKSPVSLQSGDIIIFPRGIAHRISSDSHDHMAPSDESRSATLLCGRLEFTYGYFNLIFCTLPDHFVVRVGDGCDTIHDVARVLAATWSSSGFGRQVICNKLADTLFTMAILDYAHHAAEIKGIFAGLVDSRIARALVAIHSQPGVDWSLHALADIAAMSRSCFITRFTELLGIPPFQYLAQWRANTAQRLLRDRHVSVATVAEILGYSSESAFRRFFKRITGFAPGQVRSMERASSDDNSSKIMPRLKVMLPGEERGG